MTPGLGVAGEPAPLSGPGWGGISQHFWPLALGLSHLEVPALGSSLEGLPLLDPLLQSPFVPSGHFFPDEAGGWEPARSAQCIHEMFHFLFSRALASGATG